MCGAELALLLVLSQPASTIALVINDQVRVMSVAEARQLLRSRDPGLRAAAEIAFGTLPDELTVTERMYKHDWERERWQRQPAQRQILMTSEPYVRIVITTISDPLFPESA